MQGAIILQNLGRRYYVSKFMGGAIMLQKFMSGVIMIENLWAALLCSKNLGGAITFQKFGRALLWSWR